MLADDFARVFELMWEERLRPLVEELVKEEVRRLMLELEPSCTLQDPPATVQEADAQGTPTPLGA